MIMEKEEEFGEKASNPQSIFATEPGVKKIRAGSMSMIIGVAERSCGELELEDDDYPAVPAGTVDSWL
jgi:hypothetical protein